jgi:hypothetical protein
LAWWQRWSWVHQRPPARGIEATKANLLGSLRNDAYEAAVAARREDKARNPDELDEGEKPATADPELANRPLIRE